ncbi:hypothetical protein PGT21_000471 [Puccinia graminis f. sp. tritici]|uniref:Uncharacterized protein n=1 Tax=Puccinia graminis f. sp. tritici TaxID=56615 RepID=A0A5B0LRT7_PUCGR|nr:hypothetical protein PGT21_000471 [Puccinia graminis f. sp. tritici]
MGRAHGCIRGASRLKGRRILTDHPGDNRPLYACPYLQCCIPGGDRSANCLDYHVRTGPPPSARSLGNSINQVIVARLSIAEGWVFPEEWN